LNWLSQGFAFNQDGGVWEWSALADYDTHRILRGSDGVLYCSVAQSGPGIVAGAQDPTADDGTYWGALPVCMPPLTDSSAKAATTSWVRKVISPATIYVDASTGSDSNDGLTSGTPVKTIARGLQLGDTRAGQAIGLSLAGGTYTEDVSIVRQTAVFTLRGNVTLSGALNISNSGALTVSGGGSNYSCTVSRSGGNQTISVSSDSLLAVSCPFTVVASGTATGVSITDGSLFLQSGSAFTFAITCDTVSGFALSVLDGSSVIASAQLAIGGASVAGGINVWNGSRLFLLGGVSESDILTYGAGISLQNQSEAFIGGDSVVRSGASAAASISVLYGSSFTVDPAVSSVAIYFSGPNSGGPVLAEGGSNVSVLAQAVTSSVSSAAIAAFWAEACSSIQFGSSTAISISGTYSTFYGVMFCRNNSCISIPTGVTFSGSPTGRRYFVSTGGQIFVSGAGENRIPGSAAGSASATSYGYYG
jgi:hypothetical protein